MDIKAFTKESIKYFNTAEGKEDYYYCNKCNNRGMSLEVKYINNIPYEYAKMCDCQEKRQAYKKMVADGTERLFIQQLKDLVTNTPVKEAMKQLAINNLEKPDWFYLGGQSGSCKSTVCGMLSREHLDRGHKVTIMKWVNDINQLKTDQFNRADEFRNRMNVLKNTEILFIDDLFKSENSARPTATELKLTFEIIDYRYDNNKKTIIASEFTIANLLEIDQAITGRIKEKAKDSIINIEKDINKNYRI